MSSPLDIFALYRPETGTRYFLSLQHGYPGKRIEALPIELDAKEDAEGKQGRLFDESHWQSSRIPPQPIRVKGPKQDIKTEYETKPFGRLLPTVLQQI